ncbi:hypothetical protein [Pseudomonas aphyarum]|uniref:Uncharacterized protein n=1 Tax=Pseudomonas aphyarum TaxID=2942629 RepID=A0ABT5PV51_9PSED|nr:hypothetical protein [Pseudomonas aphyarum]MDD0969700.1 hypothetical protein [Pseudomonas aphyarum]MDD1127780.1 hypothetical protein [Pseudomonas aphyarum]
MNNLPSVLVIEGELLTDVTVTAKQMATLNNARATFGELRSILLAHIVPSLEGGWSNPLATEIESRLESITFATGNFFWKSRHAGAAHDAINVEGVQ